MAGRNDNGWAKGLGVGFEMVAGMGLGAAIGYWWDVHHGASHWGLVSGLVIGGVAGTYLLVKEVIRINKD